LDGPPRMARGSVQADVGTDRASGTGGG
jgi:hypothetical protein